MNRPCSELIPRPLLLEREGVLFRFPLLTKEGARGNASNLSRGQLAAGEWNSPATVEEKSSEESVDKRVRPSIRRQKKAATRGDRIFFLEKDPENPFAPSRPHFFSGRI